MKICPECGKAFDDDRCWVCVARIEDIDETARLSLPVGCAGFIGTLVVAIAYPPLHSKLLVAYFEIGMVLFTVLCVIVSVLLHYDRLARYAVPVRLMIMLLAAAFVMPAVYFFLNGALDGSRPTQVQALVTFKSDNNGYGPEYLLVWTLSWDCEKIDQSSGVNLATFSAAEPGGFVRVIVHNGAFSQPWFSDLLPSSVRMSDPR